MTIYYSVDEVHGVAVLRVFLCLARYMEKRHSSLPGIEACICVHGCEIFVRVLN